MKLFPLLYCVFFLSYPIFSLDVYDDDHTELPKPDFSLIVKLDLEPLESLKARRDYIKSKPTGHSPKKGGKLCSSLYSPVKKSVKIEVLLKVKRPIAKKTTGKRRLRLEDFPLEESLERSCKIIFSKDTAFCSGLWSYAHPANPESSIVVDADDPLWEEYVNNFVSEINFESKKSFLVDATILIHEKLPDLAKLLFHDETDPKLVCRHFATLCLPLFSKLFAHKDCPFKGTIQQISCDFISPKWDYVEEGHVWNLLTIDYEGEQTQWLLDVFRKSFINLSKSRYLKDLILYEVQKDGIYTGTNLKPKSEYYDYANLTKDKFNITPRRQDNLCGKHNEQKLAASKLYLDQPMPESLTVVKAKKL